MQHAMAVSGYLSTLKRDLRLVNGTRFLHDLSLKTFLKTLSIDKIQCHICFLSQDIKQNGLTSYLDKCSRHKL